MRNFTDVHVRAYPVDGGWCFRFDDGTQVEVSYAERDRAGSDAELLALIESRWRAARGELPHA